MASVSGGVTDPALQVKEDAIYKTENKEEEMSKNLSAYPARVEARILMLRGQKVLLDRDLAELYGIETKTLKQAVKRNIERFPEDFAFVINREEVATLRSQFVTSNDEGRGGTRYAAMAFTEQGVSMLSSVLRSPQAVAINIEIMRTFVRLRRILESNKELARKLEELESDCGEKFRIVFEAMDTLLAPPEKKSNPIGFHVREEPGEYKVKKRKTR